MAYRLRTRDKCSAMYAQASHSDFGLSFSRIEGRAIAAISRTYIFAFPDKTDETVLSDRSISAA